MFGFIQKVLVLTMAILSYNASKFSTMKNQECKRRPKINRY